MKVKGAEVVLKTLIDEGVDTIFGYPGGSVLDIYDSLYDYQDVITHIRTSHEQGAAHSADGYARSSGKTGVVIATSGPGATNLVTGIAAANMDSVPMVCITGNVPRSLSGKDSFQEVDIIGVTAPITKANFVIETIDELQDTIRESFKIANSGRKGPVLIDIPKDILQEEVEFEHKNSKKVGDRKTIENKEARQFAEYINKSKCPVIYCGGGVTASDSFNELRALIEKNSIPACHTIMAIGVLGCEDELNLGMVGMHGKMSSNKAIEQCDLLIAIGARFSDRVALNAKKFAKNATIIQIDVDESEISKNINADFAIVGDVKDALEKILPNIDENKREVWRRKIRDYKLRDFNPESEDRFDVDKGQPLTCRPHRVIGHISKTLGDDLIYVTDVGQHQMWAAQFSMKNNPRTFLTSGGLGAMGFGYGAAIGAKVANPEKVVVHVTGDGSFHMNLNEVVTAVRYDIKIITVVMNNSSLGMVRQWQDILYKKRFSATDADFTTNYLLLSDAFGAKGYEAKNMDEFKKALEKAIKDEKPAIINVYIDSDEHVMPMIPPGKTVKDTILPKNA